MTQFPTQSHYSNIELTSSCLILQMLNAMLGGSGKYQLHKLLGLSPDLRSVDSAIASGGEHWKAL